MARLSVLTTCVGGFFALDTIEALRADRDLDIRIIGVDTNPNVVNRHFVDQFHQVPRATKTPEDFAAALFDICRKESVDVVIPGADEEVYALCAVKHTFLDSGIRCAVQDQEIAELTRDKVRFFERLSESGVPLPKFAAVTEPQDMPALAEKLGYPEKRVIVKPRTGRGARGLMVVDSEVTEVSHGEESRGYWLGDLPLLVEQLSKGAAPLQLMAMEYLPGDIFDVDCVANHGATICTVVRRRLWDTPFSRGVEGHRIERNPEMEQTTRQITELLSLSYAFDCDFGTTGDGRPGLLEVNPRWSGSVAASRAAGINVPVVLVRSMMGLPLPSMELKVGGSVVPVTRMAFLDSKS